MKFEFTPVFLRKWCVNYIIAKLKIGKKPDEI
jgi:hypothetical protein